MGSLRQDIQNAGAVASVAHLRSLGHGERLLRAAVRSGMVGVVRKGWLRLADADPDLVRAVEQGGRLGCASAARFLGWWTMDDPRLHIAVPRHSGHARARSVDGVLAHWQSSNWSAHPFAVESAEDIARQLLECGTTESSVVALESALHKGAITRRSLLAIAATLPAEAVKTVEAMSEVSESGLESLCRLRLLRLGIRTRSQVHIPTVGRVDLLVGDRLVVETDGHEWHSDPAAFTRDRDRDLRLSLIGYRALRFTYAQVMFDWPLVELAILACIARGDHRF